jgi:SAM-dependent methyltransferase
MESTARIADALQEAGAKVTGLDIDDPGLAQARERFGAKIAFLNASGDAIPMPAQSVDIVIFNHIYEHVVDADAVMADIRRVLRPDGVVYLGLGNRLGIMEPHDKLPFLCWLPKPIAQRYVSSTGRASNYYETFRARRGLRKMCVGLGWDTRRALTDWTGGQGFTVAGCDRVTTCISALERFRPRSMTQINDGIAHPFG